DGQLLYKENLSLKYFEKHGLDTKNLSLAQKHLEQLLLNAKKQNLKQTSYYALFLFDGDNMGKTLSGEILKEPNNLQEFHKKLSESLGNFAKNCKEYLDSTFGQTIYAGGDDFLGLVNLTKVYDVLQKFLEFFDQDVNQVVKNFLKEGENLSYSMGVAIAHYKTPLSEVLKWARNMEKQAKGNEGKASFAVAVLKHSGDINFCVLKWKYKKLNSFQIMQNLTSELSFQNLSNTFITEIQREFLPLVGEQDLKIDSEPFKTEFRRLFFRSTNPSLKEQNTKLSLANLCQDLENLYVKIETIQSYLHLLNISDFIRRQV
ncbi:MAG: type III-B CRISPR-associated protein Cas10/Cmr2, partial [Leptospiraceae bacterium]|nr:type III-B CRISPR-associated protein Cas10/Cmr2 [Leptospiraceae bacterium]